MVQSNRFILQTESSSIEKRARRRHEAPQVFKSRPNRYLGSDCVLHGNEYAAEAWGSIHHPDPRGPPYAATRCGISLFSDLVLDAYHVNGNRLTSRP